MHPNPHRTNLFYLSALVLLCLVTIVAGQVTVAQTAQSGQGGRAQIQFGSPNYVVTERGGSIEITVTRTGDTSSAVAVGYTTIKGTASDISDFLPSVGTLRFGPGETTKTFTVLIIQDKRMETGETVRLVLSNPSGGAGLGCASTALLTIINDDDAVSAANPIDEAPFFVRQHYLDFLNREPDAQGLAFWVDQINQCNGEPKCVEVRRINVSAAFFLSIEFHDTGYLVYRLHQAAFNTGERLPLGTYLPDSQAIRQNLIVGQGDWEAQMAANKQAYLNDFVSRQAFLDKYPPTMTAAEYVDALNANAGGSLSQSERDQLVAALAGGTISRAQALLAVADDADFDRREMNRAFVLMQYFGYMRRSPNDPPDTDFGGHAFWLAKLEEFKGNFVNAEMVKAFLVSGEYQSRFGPQTIAVTPDKIDPGQTLTVNLTGQFTGFIKDLTRASFGPGVSVGGAPPGEFGPIQVIDRTHATAQVSAAAGATLGTRSVTVTSGAERVVLDNGFDVRNSALPTINIKPTNNEVVKSTRPDVEITYSAGAGIDTSTLAIVVDGTDVTHFFVVTETKATCQIPLGGGQHIIEVRVKDKAGNPAQASSRFTVSVFRALPEAVPSSGVAPLTVTFITKAEYTDGGITRYRWDFQGDGVFDTNEPGARDFTRTFNQKGTFNALLEVRNDKNEIVTATVPIVVSGSAPRATASVNPSNGPVPLAVNFTGTGTDPDGQITKFEWDFDGNGTFDFSSTTTGNASHTYNTAGTFHAVFRVTDNDGQTATARVTASAVRVGPPGSPTARITNPANPPTGNTPFNVSFNGTGTDPGGQITKFEWDFQGDGTFDFSSTTSAATTFRYESPGVFTAALRVTDNDGLTGVDTVDITVNTVVTLSLSTDTCKPLQGGTIDVNTTLGGTLPVTLFFRNKAGQTVRTLVNNLSRAAGSHKDTWDCKDAAGQVVPEGVYYAVLQYTANGQTQTLDLSTTTGNQFFNPTWTMSMSGGGGECFSCPFRPFEDNFLKVDFTLNRAAEATVSIRLFNRVDEVALLFDRRPFGRGTHTVFWDGTDASGRLVAPPPGETFLWGMTAFTLPNNAVVVEAAPQLTAISADPNYFDPATGNFISPQQPTTKIGYTLSKQANVTLQVFRMGTNALLRTVTQPNAAAGAGTIEWDGRSDAGIFADKGDYRLALKATDSDGNQSIIRYVLVRVFY
jgi:flagellar hook assembly protein FlgD